MNKYKPQDALVLSKSGSTWNHLGSTAFTTDGSCSVTQGFVYAPFGEIVAEYQGIAATAAMPKYAFNAKELDEESGMYCYLAALGFLLFAQQRQTRSSLCSLIRRFEARYYAPPTFTSRDPLFEKYFWLSPYTYCANNPVKYVDPTGCKIKFASGTTKEQQQQFYQAIRHLDAHKCGGRYGQLKRSKITYTIAFTNNLNNVSFDPSTCTITWAPTVGVETDNNVVLSPTTILNHEMTHATHYDDAVNTYNNNYYRGKEDAEKQFNKYSESTKKDGNNPYGSIEEQSVIQGIEQRTAKLLGEIEEGQVTRTNHKGIPVNVADPTSNKKINVNEN